MNIKVLGKVQAIAGGSNELGNGEVISPLNVVNIIKVVNFWRETGCLRMSRWYRKVTKPNSRRSRGRKLVGRLN